MQSLQFLLGEHLHFFKDTFIFEKIIKVTPSMLIFQVIFSPFLYIPSFSSQTQILSWCFLRFLDKTVQKYHITIGDGEKNPRNTLPSEGATDFP